MKSVYKKMSDVEGKQSEVKKLMRVAKELGADDIIKQLNWASDRLDAKFDDMRKVVRALQQVPSDV